MKRLFSWDSTSSVGGAIPHNHKQFSDTAMCPRIHSIVTLSTRREHQTLQGKSLVLPDFLPLPTPQHTHTHFRYQSQAHGEGDGTPLQYSCLENPMDGAAWWAAVHGVTKSQTRLSDFTFTFHFYSLEKEMATHSSVLAWRVPVTVEPGGLPSMGSHRVGHDWSDLATAAAG